MLSPPPKEYLDTCPRKEKFYDKSYELIYKPKDLDIIAQAKPLRVQLKNANESYFDVSFGASFSSLAVVFSGTQRKELLRQKHWFIPGY